MLLAQNHTTLVSALVPDAAALRTLQEAGVDPTEMKGKPGGWMEFPFRASAVDRLARSGITFKILESNMEEAYASKVRGLGPFNALGFGNGSMGGHYTYWEVAKQLDTMKLLYPGLITVRQVIGTTLKGRAIWAVKISDNPDVQESEPEVLYTGLIHAREPAGMMSTIYFMWHLLTNYGTDPEATFLVNNRQIWFVPVANPDGYEYNRKFYPSGGGMHRKNARNVDTTSYGSYYGVDLNRNFGTHDMWNSSYGGSSTDPTNDTYRGTIEWSEPETAALRDFAYSHAFRTALNYHTYGDYLIYPWGCRPFETPDSAQFREYSADMTRFNGYLAGRSTTTVGYTVRGCSDDFFYGDPAKPKVFAWTPEVGDQFWADPEDILPFALENLGPNLYVARIAGSYVLPASRVIADANGNGYPERGEAFVLTAMLRNKGLSDADAVTATLSSGTPWITVPAEPVVIGTLASQATVPAEFQASVTPNSPTGVPATLYLVITDASGSSATDTIRVMIGLPAASFADSARTIANWTPQSPWGLTATNHTPPSAFTDSPSGNYASGIDRSLTLTNGINLLGATSATLTFWTRWDIEANWDFGRVEVSTNNGSTWGSLRGRYTRRGSGNGSAQPDTAFGYDGTQTGWVEEQMDLTPYANRTIKLRLRLTTDGSLEKDGWYMDDIRVLAYTPNYDTALAIAPASVTLTGITGTRVDQPVTIYNHTGVPVTLSITESLVASSPAAPARAPGLPLSFSPLIRKLRNTPLPSPVASPVVDPLAFVLAATDLRGDNLPNGVDLLDVQYQTRSTILGPVLDLRVRMITPDSNLAGFLSLDTDQDFGTGTWPAPWGLGPRSRDLGSEFEVLVDASGTIADSLGLGTLPVAVIFRTTDTSLVYVPIIPAIASDSVLTITVSGIPLNTLGVNDPDENMNVGASFARMDLTAFFPDVVPNTGHGLAGDEAGVSWVREGTRVLTVAAGDTAVLQTAVLAAVPPGVYRSIVRFSAPGQPVLSLPVQMNVTGPGAAGLTLSATALADTLAPGDSTLFVLTVGNSGTIDLLWGVLDTAGVPWVSFQPPAGIVAAGSAGQVEIRLRADGLAPGATVNAWLLIVSNDMAQPSVPFPVTLVVDDGTGVGGTGGGLPGVFRLYQNYPNPFNPSTTFRIDLPGAGEIALAAFDLLGREVRMIVRGWYPAGTHGIRWDATGLPSGTYICRLSAGGRLESRRVLLLK